MTTLVRRSPDTVDTVLLKELANRVEAADADSRVEVINAMTSRPLGEVPRCTSDDTNIMAFTGCRNTRNLHLTEDLGPSATRLPLG